VQKEQSGSAELTAKRSSLLRAPGAKSPSGRRLHWARILKRVFGIDVETGPHSQSRVRIIAAIEELAVTKKILEHLGLPARPPRIHSARGASADPV